MKGQNYRPGISPYKVRILALIAFVGWFMFVRILVSEPKEKVQPEALKVPKTECDTTTALITPYHANFYECHSDKNITANGDYGHVGGCACSIPMFINHVDMGDSVIVCDGVLKGRYIVNDISGSKLMHVDIYRNIGDKTACCYRSKIKIIRK